jgi:hypothetical protein
MNATRWLMIGALGMLGSAWAQAAVLLPPPSGEYTIGLSGWDPDNGNTFTFDPITNVNSLPDGLSSRDFNFNDSVTGFCPAGDWECSCDPGITLGPGGRSQDESGEYTFTDGNGNQVVINGVVETAGEANTGPAINNVLISVPLNSDEVDELFTCDGDDLFTKCGFYYSDPPGVAGTLYILLEKGTGTGIGTVPTPEPTQWIVLLLACVGVIAARARKGSASSSFAQTRQ